MAKKQTYASRAKAIMNRYKPRLGEKFDNGDTLALEAMNQELTALQQEQEQARAVKQQKDQQFEETAVQTFANGGKLNRRQQQTLSTILANRNTPFVQNAIQGQPTQFQASQNAVGQPSVGPQRFSGSELPAVQRGQQNLGQVGIQQNAIPFGSPRDARQFARRAPRVLDRVQGQGLFAKGGTLPRYQIGGEFANRPQYQPEQGVYDTIPQNIGAGLTPQFGGRSQLSFNEIENTDQGFAEGDEGVLPWMAQSFSGAAPVDNRIDVNALAQQNLDQVSAIDPVTGRGPDDDIPPFKSRVPYFGAVAQGLGSVLANRKIDFGDEQLNAQQVQPQTVDFSREREQFQRDRDIAQSQIRRSASQTGSQAQAMQNIITGATGTQRALGRQTSKSLQGEENINAQIRNQAGQFNAQQRARTAGLNLQRERENLLINEQRRSGRIQGVTGAITGYGKDLVSADQYDQMLQILAPENYQLGRRGPESGFRKALQISDPMQRYFQRGTARLYNE